MDFKGADIEIQLSTLEGRIVHDADKLDAIGAIGIARAFATGAHFNESLYDPDIEVPTYASAENYRAAKGAKDRTVFNHFREKPLLLLPGPVRSWRNTAPNGTIRTFDKA